MPGEVVLQAARDRRGVLSGERETGGGRPGALYEEPAGRRAEDFCYAWITGGDGQLEGRHGVLLLAPNAQRCAARYEHR